MLIVALAAFAADPDLQRHQTAWRVARDAEADGGFVTAIRSCRSALEAVPDGPRAPMCERLIERLERRRDVDGSFTGLRELHAVRQEYRAMDPEVARSRVEAIALGEGTTSTLASEVGIWLARDALDRLDSPERALASTGPVMNEVERLEPSLAARLQQVHALALARAGRLDEAAEAEAPVRVSQTGDRRTPVEQVAWDRTRRAGSIASLWVLAGFAVVALPLAARNRAQWMALRPRGLALLWGAGLATGAVAWAWSASAAIAVPWMLAGWSVLHVVTLAGLQGSGRWGPVLRVLAALATVAVGWLALWMTGSDGWVVG